MRQHRVAEAIHDRGRDCTDHRQSVEVDLLAWDWGRGLRALWRARLVLAVAMLLAGLTAATIGLVQPDEYTATATLLPIRGERAGAGALASLAGAAGGGFGSLLGLNVAPEHTSSQLYPTYLASLSVVGPLFHRPLPRRPSTSSTPVTLADYLGEADPQRLTDGLQLIATVDIDRTTGVARLAATTDDPVFSAALVNALVGELRRITSEVGAERAAQGRAFAESRLVVIKAELEQAESRLRTFREQNRNYAWSDNPTLRTEDARLEREVLLKSNLFVQVSAEYELARLEENKTVDQLVVIDSAHAPVDPSGPARRRNAMAATVGTGFLGAAGVLLWSFAVAVAPPAAHRTGRSIRRRLSWRRRRESHSTSDTISQDTIGPPMDGAENTRPSGRI